MATEPVWAVVLVHGVGYVEPGETLDCFMSGIRDAVPGPGGTFAETDPPAVVLLDPPPPHLPEHTYTPLPAPSADFPLKSRFPMALRRGRVQGPQGGTPHKSVFAEVYWADIAATRSRLLNILLRMVTIIFHLRFVLDRAATLADGRGRWPRFFLFLASYLLCGPVAALNVVALGLLASHLLESLVRSVAWRGLPDLIPDGRVTVACGLLVALALALLWHKAVARLFRQALAFVLRKNLPNPGEDTLDVGPWKLLLWWMVVVGLAIGLLAGLRWLAPAAFTRLGLETVLQLIHPVEGNGLSVFFSVLIFLLVWAYFGLLVLLLLPAALGLGTYLLAPGEKKLGVATGLAIAFGALLLQLGSWLLLVLTVCDWILNREPEILKNIQHSPFLVVPVAYLFNLALAVVVIVAVLSAWVARRRWGRTHSADYADLKVARELPRLLINSRVVGALFLVWLIGLGVSTYTYFFQPQWMQSLLDPYARVTPQWTAVIVSLLGLFLLGFLGSLVHILLDIADHFIMPGLKVPWPWKSPPKLELDQFVTQMRIEARFRRVLEEVLKDNDVTHLTVVSHSQGAVIAVTSLWLDWTADLLRQKNVSSLYFVTMGSPFTYLYQHYFPERYPALFRNGAFNDDRDTGWGVLYQTFQERFPFSQWVNIFRVNDPIGTHIDGDNTDGTTPGTFPENHVVGFRGHLEYFTDADVLRIMRPYLPVG